MSETSLANVVKDFKLKYEGCYIFVKMPDNQVELCLVRNVLTSPPYNVLLVSDKLGDLAFSFESEFDFYFKWPEVRQFNFRKAVVMFSRAPYRTTKKAPCPGGNNYQVRDVKHRLPYSGISRPQGAAQHALLRAAYEPVYYNFSQAMRKFEDDSSLQGVALNDTISIQKLDYIPDKYLFVQDIPAAVVGPDKIIIKERNVGQEVEDFCAQEGLKFSYANHS